MGEHLDIYKQKTQSRFVQGQGVTGDSRAERCYDDEEESEQSYYDEQPGQSGYFRDRTINGLYSTERACEKSNEHDHQDAKQQDKNASFVSQTVATNQPEQHLFDDSKISKE